MKNNVAGLSISTIASMPTDYILTLNRQELSRLVSRLASAGNKRLKRLETEGLAKLSPAVYQSKKISKGRTRKSKIKKFSTKGKTLNELRSEYVRAVNFLNTKTSTVKGTKQYLKNVGNIVKSNPSKAEKKRIAEFFEVLHNLKESDPAFFEDSMKYKIVMNELTDVYRKGMSSEDMLSSIMSRMKSIYEEEEQQRIDTENKRFHKIK